MHAVVVGGGIIGLASAYYLRRRDVDVTLLEKTRIGAGSTERAGGGIRAQFSTEESIRLSQESIAVWEDFEETFGVDIQYRRPGYLYLARTDETADQLHESVAFHNDHGVPSEFISPAEAADLLPELHVDRYVGATYCPTDGHAEPPIAIQGFALGAAREGAIIRVGVGVTDVIRENGRVTGVETTDGRIEADSVVNAAGGWAAEVAAMAGIDLPVRPKRRQLMIVEPDTPLPDDSPFTTDLDDGSYFRSKDGDAAMVGGHFDSADPAVDPSAYTEEYDPDWAERTLEHASECTRYFSPTSHVRRGWAGMYAMTPDHHPIIEETIPGFVNAVGFSGHGFMQSPATGQLVAEIVADGTASLVDVSRLTADRFDRGEALHETFYSA